VPTCFVIQPFDKGQYDKRYNDVLKPAITDADLEPYRVDEDPEATILIENIETGIRQAEVCLADITTNNPNIWYEVGFALACGKSVVLICGERTEAFPFDIRHRSIVNYARESSSDFDALRKEITKRLTALAKKAETLQAVEAMSQLETTEGLPSHEIGVVMTLMADRTAPTSAMPPHEIKNSMRRSGYTNIATGLALEGLQRKKMIEFFEEIDWNGNTYTSCRLTEKGVDWLLNNQDRFRMRKDEESAPPITDEDFPF
jgi:nucleoside 2-deoxyribosyltransferase